MERIPVTQRLLSHSEFYSQLNSTLLINREAVTKSGGRRESVRSRVERPRAPTALRRLARADVPAASELSFPEKAKEHKEPRAGGGGESYRAGAAALGEEPGDPKVGAAQSSTAR